MLLPALLSFPLLVNLRGELGPGFVFGEELIKWNKQRNVEARRMKKVVVDFQKASSRDTRKPHRYVRVGLRRTKIGKP